MKKWAESNNFQVVVDAAENVLITVPPSPGYEHVPGLCMQCHTDMVCVKDPEVVHDFIKDPLKLRIDGEWLKASRTTLGADNGMGIAMAFGVVTDKNIKHGLIEILLTSDEEIGLIGASQLKTCLKSKYLLNLDSEEIGEICVSCAGGFRVQFEKQMQRTAVEQGRKVFKLKITGYLGGHSGCDIHLFRANAFKQMAKLLSLLPKDGNVRLVSIDGGSAHNAIPAFCTAVIALQPPAECKCEQHGEPLKKMQQLFNLVHEQFAVQEKDAKIELEEVKAADAFSAEDTQKIIGMLLNIMHGPQRISQTVKNFVETSFATTIIKTEGDKVNILGSGRSCYE